MSLVHQARQFGSLNEGIAVSILFRDAKLVGIKIVPNFQHQIPLTAILSRTAA
jgi:hypothetical protein